MREKIRLNSSAGTGHFYTTTKNKKTMTDKMEIKKFDPKARKHVMYKEAKIKYFYLPDISPDLICKSLCGKGICIPCF